MRIVEFVSSDYLLYMRPHTTVYVPSYVNVCRCCTGSTLAPRSYVLILRHMCPHTSTYAGAAPARHWHLARALPRLVSGPAVYARCSIFFPYYCFTGTNVQILIVCFSSHNIYVYIYIRVCVASRDGQQEHPGGAPSLRLLSRLSQATRRAW